MIVVRAAGLTDLSEIVAWGKARHAESNWDDDYNAPWFRKNVQDALRNPTQIVLIAKRHGKVCGLLMGATMHMLTSPRLCAADQLFVAEAGGAQLLDAFLAWCRRMKVKRLDMGVSQADRKGMDRFFRSRGLTRAGGMYYRNFGGSQ